ncbi:CRTAC1 family protein [Pelagicoccus mobilis]|uniref:CRTAC1 family protein n=1 Tax=Pelagicoccus mobilis TaxID=415221 RepID=A0A934VT03_9BACT|nr:CRTAC1 family protein [Pelagicoccus mobilis]MBK1879188.1 CRTAC1 family protein [Pelagicoccus mobilis]
MRPFHTVKKHCTSVALLLYASQAIYSQSLADLNADKQRLDSSVWQQEIEAQDYEEAFIRLWDSLRANEDAFPILKSFPFETLSWGEMKKSSQMEHGIFVSTFSDQPSQRITKAQWVAWLDAMKSSGFVLEMSEWHHKRFATNEEGIAESTVSCTLYAKHAAKQTRYLINAYIDVEWMPERNAEGYFPPRHLSLKKFEILNRPGAPLFENVGKLQIPPKQRGPIVAYDLNHDGFVDLVLPSANLIAWNSGDGFTTERISKQAAGNVRAAVLGDFDGDGRVDLMVEGTLSDKGNGKTGTGLYLFQGQESGRFSQSPQKIVTDPPIHVKGDTSLTSGDIDKDGDLDIWLSHYKEPYKGGSMPTPYYDSNDGHPSWLLINDGTGTRFTDETQQRGISEKQHRRAFSSSFFDYDNDSDLDLLVVADFAGIDLYQNDGHGIFSDVTESSIEHRHLFGMGHSIGDFNSDGMLDMYVIGMSSTTASRLHDMGAFREDAKDLSDMRIPMTYGNRLYYSNGDGTYSQPKLNDQIARTGWSWGVVTVDFDNDSKTEYYVANGHDSNTTSRDYCSSYWTDDIYRGSSDENPLYDSYFMEKLGFKEDNGISWNGFEKNFLWHEMSDGNFRNISYLGDVALEEDSRVVLAEDLNNDGKIDLLVDHNKPDWDEQTEGSTLSLFLNQFPTNNNWIGFRFKHAKGHLAPEGARITLSVNGRKKVAAIINGESYEGQSSPTRHFGLGDSESIDYVQIDWLNGESTRIESPDINRYHEVSMKR